jgi:hypothetical protein
VECQTEYLQTIALSTYGFFCTKPQTHAVMATFLRDPNRDTWFASERLDAYRIDPHAIVCDLYVALNRNEGRC